MRRSRRGSRRRGVSRHRRSGWTAGRPRKLPRRGDVGRGPRGGDMRRGRCRVRCGRHMRCRRAAQARRSAGRARGGPRSSRGWRKRSGNDKTCRDAWVPLHHDITFNPARINQRRRRRVGFACEGAAAYMRLTGGSSIPRWGSAAWAYRSIEIAFGLGIRSGLYRRRSLVGGQYAAPRLPHVRFTSKTNPNSIRSSL